MTKRNINDDCFNKLDLVLKAVSDVDDSFLEVGWFEDDLHPHRDGVQVAQVAVWNEFHANARPFMRPMVASKTNNWRELAEKKGVECFEGNQKLSYFLKHLGDSVQEDVKDAIRDESTPLTDLSLALRRHRTDLGRNPLGKKFIGKVAKALASGKTGLGELAQPSNNAEPLVDTGVMLETVKYKRGKGVKDG